MASASGVELDENEMPHGGTREESLSARGSFMDEIGRRRGSFSQSHSMQRRVSTDSHSDMIDFKTHENVSANLTDEDIDSLLNRFDKKEIHATLTKLKSELQVPTYLPSPSPSPIHFYFKSILYLYFLRASLF